MSATRSPSWWPRAWTPRATPAEAIAVDYEDLPAIVDPVQALVPGAPLVWDEAPATSPSGSARAIRWRSRPRSPAPRIGSSSELENNRVVVAALEPRAAIGRHDQETGSFTLVLTGQGVHDMRRQLAEDVFRVPLDGVQLVAPDVGGGFGAKNILYPEWVWSSSPLADCSVR